MAGHHERSGFGFADLRSCEKTDLPVKPRRGNKLGLLRVRPPEVQFEITLRFARRLFDLGSFAADFMIAISSSFFAIGRYLLVVGLNLFVFGVIGRDHCLNARQAVVTEPGKECRLRSAKPLQRAIVF